MDLSTDEIYAGLSNLPQELYDEIYKLTFTAPRGDIPNLIIRNLNNPSLLTSMNLLHISQSTRAQYGASFYNAEIHYSATTAKFIQFVALLPREHLSHIHKMVKVGDKLELQSTWQNSVSPASYGTAYKNYSPYKSTGGKRPAYKTFQPPERPNHDRKSSTAYHLSGPADHDHALRALVGWQVGREAAVKVYVRVED